MDKPLVKIGTENDDQPPLIIHRASIYPFVPGERARDWREATDAEYQRYIDFYNEHDD